MLIVRPFAPDSCYDKVSALAPLPESSVQCSGLPSLSLLQAVVALILFHLYLNYGMIPFCMSFGKGSSPLRPLSSGQ